MSEILNFARGKELKDSNNTCYGPVDKSSRIWP